MSLSEADVIELARAARLALTSEEITRYAQDLEALETLAEVLLVPFENTTASTAPIALEDMCNDSAAPCLSKDELLRLAPVTKGEAFAVPRAVEGI